MRRTEKILQAIEDGLQINNLIDQRIDVKLWEQAFRSDYPTTTNHFTSKNLLVSWCEGKGYRYFIDSVGYYVLKKVI